MAAHIMKQKTGASPLSLVLCTTPPSRVFRITQKSVNALNSPSRVFRITQKSANVPYSPEQGLSVYAEIRRALLRGHNNETGLNRHEPYFGTKIFFYLHMSTFFCTFARLLRAEVKEPYKS